jgi:methanogenic corrinoid protein MtbC1
MMIGSDVPPDALAAAARRHRPDVVGLSATMPDGEDHLLIAMHAIEQSWPSARFVIGGRALTSRVRGRRGIEVCQRVSDVVAAADALVKRAELN